MNNSKERKENTKDAPESSRKDSRQNNSKAPFYPRTLFQHTRGVPPSPLWLNNFSAIVIDQFLLYISNCFIVSIDLKEKAFHQSISSNFFTSAKKPNLLLQLSERAFAAILKAGNFVLFKLENEHFTEIPGNPLPQAPNSKCAVALNLHGKTIIVASSQEKNIAALHLLQYAPENKITKLKTFPFKDTEITYIEKLNDSFFAVAFIDQIEIFQIDSSASAKSTMKIPTQSSAAIFSVDYDPESNTLFTLNKNGTFTGHQILFDQNQYKDVVQQKNKYNDKSIKEKYLFFSLKYIGNNALIISSNSGRLFKYNFKDDKTEEVPENPHKESIFNIIKRENQLIFVSSDHSISFFEAENLNFLYAINCIEYVPKNMLCSEKKLLFTLQNENESILYIYNYSKQINKLSSFKKRLTLSSPILEVKLNPLNSNVLAFLCEKEILLYDIENEENLFHKLLNQSQEVSSLAFIDQFLYCKMGNVLCIIDYFSQTEKYLTIGEEAKLVFDSLKVLDKDVLINVAMSQNSVSASVLNRLLSVRFFHKNISAEKDTQFCCNHPAVIKSTSQYRSNFLVTDKTNLIIIKLSLSEEIIQSFSKLRESYEAYLEYSKKIREGAGAENFEIREYESIFNGNVLCMEVGRSFSSLIVSQSDGVVNVYDILEEGGKVYLLHIIKAHYLAVTCLLVLSEEVCFVSGSLDHSVKFWSCEKCNKLSILYLSEDSKSDSISIGKKEKSLPSESEAKYTNYFSQSSSLCFFQQSLNNAKAFIENFEKFISELDDSKEIEMKAESSLKEMENFLFLFSKNEKNNYISAYNVIKFESGHAKNQSDAARAYLNIYLSELKKHINVELLETEKVEAKPLPENYVDTLIKKKGYVEAIVYTKTFTRGIEEFFLCLEKIKKEVYSKQTFQCMKLQRVIEILSHNEKNN